MRSTDASEISALPGTEVSFLRSEHVGDEFKVIVGHCGGAESALPVPVFFGDTWMHFGTALEVARLLRLTEVVPSLLVVGVGYRTTDLGEIFRLRHRDFTPTVAAESGADRFLAFLTDELKPWLEARCSSRPEATRTLPATSIASTSSPLTTGPNSKPTQAISEPTTKAIQNVWSARYVVAPTQASNSRMKPSQANTTRPQSRSTSLAHSAPSSTRRAKDTRKRLAYACSRVFASHSSAI